MTDSSESSAAGPVEDRRATALGTLPLALVAAALFAAAVAEYLDDPTLGPARYPLWGLFLTLAIVASVGTFVSWFFAADLPASSAEETAGAATASRAEGQSSRTDLGRPRPETAAAPRPKAFARGTRGGTTASDESEPWDEDVLPPAEEKGPRPVLTSPYDPGDIGRALEEIADIQRELMARRSTSPAVADASARA